MGIAGKSRLGALSQRLLGAFPDRGDEGKLIIQPSPSFLFFFVDAYQLGFIRCPSSSNPGL
jgi:hypothetical protein